MTDANAPDATPESFSDLPIQPTGSGVVDLEIAYEQMRLAEDADAADALGSGATDEIVDTDAGMKVGEDRDDIADTVAHPS